MAAFCLAWFYQQGSSRKKGNCWFGKGDLGKVKNNNKDIPLKSLDDEVLEASLVRPYLTHLDSCVQNFMNAAASVVDTKAQKEIGAAKSAADVCYQAWLDLAKFLEVAADSGLVDHAEDAIVRLNVMNAEIKSRMNVRSAQKDKGVFEDIAAPEA